MLSSFEFSNQYRNNPNMFFGYEIVYKIYTPDDEVLNDDTFIKNDGENFLTEAVLNNLFNMTNLADLKGYRRMISEDEDENSFRRPLIPILPEFKDSRTLIITIGFDNIENQTIIYEGHSSILFARSVNTGSEIITTGFKPGDFASNDDDITFTFSEPGSKAVLALFAVSFGKYEVFKSIYSKAVYLGQININLN